MPDRNLAIEAMLRAEDAVPTDPVRDRSKPLPSFAVRDLSVLAYANGFTLWHYKAKQIADVRSANYFGDASDMIAAGDHIHISAPDGGALLNVAESRPAEVVIEQFSY